jgi:hypothetical protein
MEKTVLSCLKAQLTVISDEISHILPIGYNEEK